MLFIAEQPETVEAPDSPPSADPKRSCGADMRLPSERRRGLRVWQSRPVKVFEPRLSRYFGGQTENISTTGLRVELPASTPVREGAVLEILVGPSATGQVLANRRQMIPAKVIWVDRSPSKGKLLAGVEFLASIAARVDAA